MKNLWQALLNAQKEFKPIEKKSTVSFGKTNFKYADLEELITKTRPALQKHGLIVIQDLTHDENGRRSLKTRLIHAESGEFYETHTALCQVSESAKDIGAATTYMRRYSYSALLGLVADEDRDAENESLQSVSDDPTLNAAQLSQLHLAAKKRSMSADELVRAVGFPAVGEIKESAFPLLKKAICQKFPIEEGNNV